MSKLESTKRWSNHRSVIQESLVARSVTIGEIMELRSWHSWMHMYLKWFRDGDEPIGLEAQAILKKKKYSPIPNGRGKVIHKRIFDTVVEVCRRI